MSWVRAGVAYGWEARDEGPVRVFTVAVDEAAGDHRFNSVSEYTTTLDLDPGITEGAGRTGEWAPGPVGTLTVSARETINETTGTVGPLTYRVILTGEDLVDVDAAATRLREDRVPDDWWTAGDVEPGRP